MSTLTPIDTDQIQGKLKSLKGRLKKTYGTLVNDDELFAEGREDELAGKLQEKLGKSRKELVAWLNEF